MAVLRYLRTRWGLNGGYASGNGGEIRTFGRQWMNSTKLQTSGVAELLAQGASARFPWIAILVVLGVPAVQLSFGPAWMYTPPSIDPWVYHGYFLHLNQHMVVFNGTYYGNRLAWILPGYLAHHFFPAQVANAILRLFLYWMAVLSTFFLVRRSYGDRCALVTSLLLCGYGSFLGAIGWDYVDGAGIAYSLLCLEELSAGASRFNNWSPLAVRRCVFAGIAFAAAIHSNMMLLCFVPALAVFFLSRTGWSGLPMAIPAVFGVGALTAILGAASLRLGGPFLFFWPSLLVGASLGKRNPWSIQGLAWTAHAWWLVIPSVACLLAVFLAVKLLARRRSGTTAADDATRLGDAACALLAFAIFGSLNALGNPVLQLVYYASYLSIFAVVIAGAFIGRKLESWKLSSFLGLAAACMLLSVVLGAGLAPKIPYLTSPVFRRVVTLGGAPEIALAAVFGAGIVLSDWIKPRVLSATMASACVGVLLLHVGLVSLAARPGARDLFLDVSRTSRRLAQLTAAQTLWFWYDEPSDFDGRCISIASNYLWGYRLLSRTLPDTSKFLFGTVRSGDYLAVMDRRPAALTEALANLERGGLTLKPIKTLPSPTAASDYVLELVQVTGTDGAAGKQFGPP